MAWRSISKLVLMSLTSQQSFKSCYLHINSPELAATSLTSLASISTQNSSPSSHEVPQELNAPSPISRLPPELLLRTLELATLGRAAFLRTRLLLSTSLVAPSWRAPSQLLLRSNVIIGSDEAAESALPLLEGRWAKELRFERTARKLEGERVEKVLGSVSGVGRLVLDRLDCSAAVLVDENMAGELFRRSALAAFSADLVLLRRPTGLRSLDLHTTLTTSYSDTFYFAFNLHHLSLHPSHANDPSLISALLTHSSRTLTSLGLKWGRCTSFQPEDVTSLIVFAPRLQHLNLNLLEIPTPTPPAELATFLAHCTALRFLTIEGLGIESLIPVLSSLAPCTRLVVLALQFPLFYDLVSAEVGRSFHQALRLPAMQGLRRWRIVELKAKRLDEVEGRKWREECERRGVEIRDEKRVFGVDG